VVGPDPYRRLATDLGRHGPAVVADLAGDHLGAVLDGRPRLVKVTHDEVVAGGWAASDGRDDLVDAIHSLHGAGAESIVVSRAADPALALLDDIIYEVVTPTLGASGSARRRRVDDRGNGGRDGQGHDLPTAVRMGAAAGALNVTRHGLGTGNADAVAVLADRVQFRPHRLSRQPCYTALSYGPALPCYRARSAGSRTRDVACLSASAGVWPLRLERWSAVRREAPCCGEAELGVEGGPLGADARHPVEVA
jgi:hypothetical protein